MARCLWDRYWGRAGQLLANFPPLFLITVPEVFAKVNSAQFFLLVSKVATAHSPRAHHVIARLWWHFRG